MNCPFIKELINLINANLSHYLERRGSSIGRRIRRKITNRKRKTWGRRTRKGTWRTSESSRSHQRREVSEVLRPRVQEHQKSISTGKSSFSINIDFVQKSYHVFFFHKYDSDQDEKPLKPRTRERDRDYLPKTRDSDEDEEESKDSNYSDDDDGRPSKSFARTNFTNALLKAGTKSTKDSSLDKPVRKTPGLLLEAAGRSLLNKAGGGSTLNYKSGGSSILSGGATSGGLSFGLVSSKISFGLYGGHLPVDHGSYTKPKDEDNSDSRSDSSTR